MPWLTRPAQRRIVPIEAYPVKGGRRRIYSGIRYGDLTYVRSTARASRSSTTASRDPGELVNVARKPAYRTTLVQLRTWNTPLPQLRRHRLSAGVRARRAERRVLPRIVLSAQTTAMSKAMMMIAHAG